MLDGSTEASGPAPPRRRLDVVLAWAATVWTALYAVYFLRFMMRLTGAFGAVLDGLGAGLGAEWPTLSFLFRNYQWLYPIAVGLIVVLVVLKELWIRDKRLSLIVTLSAVVALQTLMTVVADLYMRPMTDMMEKLAR